MKQRVGTEMTKEEEANAPVQQQFTPPAQTFVSIPQQIEQADHAASTCWYVFGVLATIFCCLPCGIVGLVHAMIAKHEGERGNIAAHKRRLSQAKCWTSWSIALGLLLVVLCIIWAVVANYYWAGYGYDYIEEGGMDKDYEPTKPSWDSGDDMDPKRPRM